MPGMDKRVQGRLHATLWGGRTLARYHLAY